MPCPPAPSERRAGEIHGPQIGDIIGRAPLFRGVPGAVLERAHEAARVLVVPAKTVLFHQGDAPSQLILVGKGFVKMGQVSGRGEASIIRVMEPGDIIGCVALFRRKPYPATATTLIDSLTLSWPAGWVLDLLEQCPEVQANALEIVGSRAEELVHGLHGMATARVERRVARALLRLAERAGQAAAEGTEIGFPLSRQEIAEMVGTDVFGVSRILRRWADQRLVIADRLRVVVRDRKRLRCIADGAFEQD